MSVELLDTANGLVNVWETEHTNLQFPRKFSSHHGQGGGEGVKTVDNAFDGINLERKLGASHPNHKQQRKLCQQDTSLPQPDCLSWRS